MDTFSIIASLIAIICAGILIINSNNSKSNKALKTVSDMKYSFDDLREQVTGIEKQVQEIDKMKQKIDWLEIKAKAQSNRIIIAQEAPFKMNFVYKEASKPIPLTDKEVKKAIIDKVKVQLSELSQ
jgi:iron uptake system EfeUOB component EfeO/EfeM